MNLKRIRDYIILKIGSLCHRKESRSFHTNSHQSIVCTRCSSIYIGFLLTFVFLLLYGFYYVNISIIFAILLIVPIIIDGLTQAMKYRKSNNKLRIVSGLMLGSSFSLLLGKSIQENLNLLIKEVFRIPNIPFLLFLIALFLPLYIINKKSTPKNIYLIDGLVFIGYLNIWMSLSLSVLTTITKYVSLLI
ncbi:MAG: DUF2085 domain-containing protein [Candidatus Aenigmatarchaeota archaeon]